MVFPTVEDCLKSKGTKRNVLHGFDQLLREALGRTRLKARHLDLDDDDVGMGCVTVMMTVAADLALAASDNLADIEARHFSRPARTRSPGLRADSPAAQIRDNPRLKALSRPHRMVSAIRAARTGSCDGESRGVAERSLRRR